MQSSKASTNAGTEGFTLIELLVVVIIVGILAAIALPSFLNQVNKAKETEAKQYIGSMNRAQQAYLLEQATFASDISLLGLGIKTATTNYSYAIQDASETSVINVSYPKFTDTLRAITGGVQTATTATNESTSLAELCQSMRPQDGDPNGVQFTDPTTDTGPYCDTPNFESLGK